MIPNSNDGSKRAPRLRIDISAGNVWTLPPYSKGPRGSDDEIMAALSAAGYEGVQGKSIELCRKHGLAATGGGRVNTPEEAEPIAKQHKEMGYDLATLHVGWGHEDDATLDRLTSAIIEAADKHRFPLYMETHRATIIQDPFRTVQLVKRFPALRFNGDFSHWYTGLEMRYGDYEEKLAFIAPVLERVRFIHGRIGNSSHMQIALSDPSAPKAIADFKELWTRSFTGFLKTAQPGDILCFTPELLHPEINYARLFLNAKGEWVEESDRWTDALKMCEIAKEAFAEAQRRVALK